MLHEVKLNLTFSHHCVNPQCQAPLYKELMRERDQEACDECDPPIDEIPNEFGISFVPPETVRFLQGRCDEACCIKESVLAAHQERRDVRDALACIDCGTRYRRDEAARYMDGLRCKGGCIRF